MKRSTKASLATNRLARGGMIAALYVALTYVAMAFGLSSGVIQFRISEALCVLPIFLPEAIPGLAVGCFAANLLTGCAPWDILFGTVATLIGAVGAYLIGKKLPPWVATIPTVLANAIIVPFILMYVYEAEGTYLFFMATVGLGEIVCATGLGALLAGALNKSKVFGELFAQPTTKALPDEKPKNDDFDTNCKQ